MKDPLARHVLLPLLAPIALIGLYYTPVTLIGCANRGLAALAVVFVSLITAIAVGVVGLKAKARGEATGWWAVSMFILAVPALLLLGPLG